VRRGKATVQADEINLAHCNRDRLRVKSGPVNVSSSALPRWFNTVLWGVTVALAWTWGLGLFFSVQFTMQFGMTGLLCFAIPNALGLILFGFITHHLARKTAGSDSLANFFSTWSRPFRLAFFLYQILAITLTLFAFIRYGWQPLGLEPDALYLPLTALIALSAGILFGEEFNIKRIKWSHGVLFLLLGAAIAGILILPWPGTPGAAPSSLENPLVDMNFFGYLIPLVIGLLVGPWMDLQQWQRAIQMHRERVSIAAGYIVGALIFFGLLLFHGSIALMASSRGGYEMIRTAILERTYAQELVNRFLFSYADTHTLLFACYAVFLCVCVLTTLDSGYVALRWFLTSNVRRSQHPIFSLVPEGFVTSPIPWFFFAAVVSLVGVVFNLELEYFMIFYATFFVGYSLMGIFRAYAVKPGNALPQVKMFSIGSLAVVIFAYGYFLNYPLFQILGALLPVTYVLWSIIKPTSSEDFVKDSEELDSPAPTAAPAIRSDVPAESEGGQPGQEASGGGGSMVSFANPLASTSGYFEGNWFIHTFVATYADTNSVGNVYFGMYAMWVGKTRELFFNKVMPKFNLRDTPFYILTRSFEHKFMRETREFETVSVRIRIGDYNRKFVTLEHEIYDSSNELLGKGKQTLLFVSSNDYRMLDIPPDVYQAFLKYTGRTPSSPGKSKATTSGS